MISGNLTIQRCLPDQVCGAVAPHTTDERGCAILDNGDLIRHGADAGTTSGDATAVSLFTSARRTGP